MTNNEKKFWNILTNLFVGAEVKGKSGFINLMRAKESYFKKIKKELLGDITNITHNNENFKDEIYDKLFSFFHRYFNDSGSIFYNYTPLFYNIYTKAYGKNMDKIKTYSSDYEQIISNKKDISLFYKTQMLYYVKSDKIFKNLEVRITNIGGRKEQKYFFDTLNLEEKYANEKKNLVYKLKSIENEVITFNVQYSKNGSVTKIEEIIKECKKSKIILKEEELKKAFSAFEKQSNIDFFINKNAKKFLNEQLDMWIYQYMFKQSVDFDIARFNQIQDFKNIANKIINFISQFENELVKIWNKPRFVLNSNIVITIDKLKDKGFDIAKLRNHKNFKDQQKEWTDLGIAENIGLLENDFLPIDTKFFSEFKDEIEELFNEDEFDGLLIKSENYQALHTLKQKYNKKVKLIYIDPPYNTGGDGFIYMDNFNHSSWLCMMENRLNLAKEFLKDNGVIFIQCDDNEQAYLKVLMDDIFGRDNFVNTIAIRSSTPSGLKTAHREKTIIKTKDYILVYAKNANNITLKPQYIENDSFDNHFNYFFDRVKNNVYQLKQIIIEKEIYPENIPFNNYSFENKEFKQFVYDNANNIFQTGKNMPENIREISLLPENENKIIPYNNEEQFAFNGRRASFLSNNI